MTQALRVLLVEDSPTDAKLVIQGLRQTKRTIDFERVEDPIAMRAALEAGGWDLVISDWAMPKFSALAALDLVKQMGLDLPFIIVSGTIGEESAVEAMRAGAHDYVLKDNLARLAPAVERELRDHETRKASRLAERAHRETEERYRRIVETTTEGVWTIDAELETTFMNARMIQMLGCDANEVVGLSPADFLDEEGMALLARSLRAPRAGCSEQIECQLKARSGATLWALVEVSPILDATGRFDGALAMVADVSERREAQKALRASESRFKRLWDSGLILITISDMAGNLVDVNEAGARMLGYTRAELLAGNVTWDGLTTPESKELDRGARAQLTATGVAAPWEQEFFRKDGSRLPLLAGAATLAGDERIAIAVDLTERKKAENANLERMRIASMGAAVGVALTQQGGLRTVLQRCAEAMVEHVDAAFARIWTLNAREGVLELQASAGVYTQVDGPHARVPVGEQKVGWIARERRPHVTNDLARDALVDPEWAKREGMIAYAGYPLLVGGELVGVLGVFARHVFTDAALNGLASIADEIAIGLHRVLGDAMRETLEGQLRQAQKMEAVGRLAGGVAHDFNNLLSVILSYSELTLEGLQPDDPMHGDIEEIRKAGLRASALTRQLLMFSRQQVLEPKVLDLNDVLSSLDNMVRRVVGEDIDLALVTSKPLGRIHADLHSIEQVVLNLVVNARDAMPTGGKLTIEATNVDLDAAYTSHHVGIKAGPHVMLAVTDTGIGMDAATQARIFEPFFTTKSKEKGTGLGLSTVFGIVHQSGGGVWVYSEPGIGTTFKVYLPRIDGPVDETPLQPPSAAAGGSETILLVEDDDMVRRVALGILRRNGYQVLEARNAGEAILHSEQHAGTIHLLLTDVVMPQMSGPELAKRLVKERPDLKVICMSGYTDDSIVRHGVLRAELAYLQKPFTPDALVRKLRATLDAEGNGTAGPPGIATDHSRSS